MQEGGPRACGRISNTLRPRVACSSACARSVTSTAPSTASCAPGAQLRKCTLTQNLLCSTAAPSIPATLRSAGTASCPCVTRLVGDALPKCPTLTDRPCWGDAGDPPSTLKTRTNEPPPRLQRSSKP